MSDIRIKMAKDLRDMSDMVGDLHWMAAKAVEDLIKKDARIVELENAAESLRISRDYHHEQEVEYRRRWAGLNAAPVSEAKAQGVVMPEAEDFCFCGKHVSLQMISGGASKHGYLGSVTLLIDGKYVEYTRLNAAPAAPAAGGVVEALRELAEQFREAWPDHTGKYHFLIGAGLSIAANRAKGVV